MRILLAVLLALPVVVMAAQTAAPDAALEHARRVLRATPIIDGHNDYPWQVRDKGKMDLAAFDIAKPQPALMTDAARLRAGGVGGQFWSVYVDVKFQGGDAVQATLEQIDIVHRMVASHPDVFAMASTADDVVRLQKAGKIASMIGVEGGHCIAGSLGVLREFYRLGARYMTLTHFTNTPWADSATDTPQTHGLSAFGEDVVREMNRLGMLVDLSHVSAETMAAALRVSTSPVIFTHSSARALVNVPRNVPDDILRELRANGGVIMITFVPSFDSQAVADYTARETAEQKRLGAAAGATPASIDAGMAAWHRANPAPRATIAQVADHIDHVRHLIGVDSIGIGSDFDGIESVPLGLEDVSTYPALFAELIKRGYTDEELGKIAQGNVLRVMREAEKRSAAKK